MCGQYLTSVYMDAKASGPEGRTDGERPEGLAAGNLSPALWRGDGATSVKGYERIPKSSGKKITFTMSEIRSAPDSVPTSRAEQASTQGNEEKQYAGRKTSFSEVTQEEMLAINGEHGSLVIPEGYKLGKHKAE